MRPRILAVVLLAGICIGVTGGQPSEASDTSRASQDLEGLAAEHGLSGELIAALITASATILAAVGTIVYGQQRAKGRDIREAHRPHKIKLYQDFMKNTLLSAFFSVKEPPKSPSAQVEAQKKLEAGMASFTADVIVWGSPPVIAAVHKFRRHSSRENQLKDPTILLRMDEMLRAIRTDLGNSNRGIPRGRLMSLFLKNPDEFYTLMRMRLPRD